MRVYVPSKGADLLEEELQLLDEEEELLDEEEHFSVVATSNHSVFL